MTTICDLTEKTCVPCEGGVAPILRDEALSMLESLEGWQLSEEIGRAHV